jgi:hypothetical protein
MSRSEGGGSEREALQALELAEGYLENAENVLWTGAVEIDTKELADRLNS